MSNEVIIKQPLPVTTDESVEVLPLIKMDMDSWNLDPLDWYLFDDMKQRIDTGEKEYGKRLSTYNGRNPIRDAYEELLDAVIYIRQAITEKMPMYETQAITTVAPSTPFTKLLHMYFKTFQLATQAKELMLLENTLEIQNKIGQNRPLP